MGTVNSHRFFIMIESLKAIVKTRTTKQYLHELHKQESNTGDHIMVHI